jgi:pimeloyl-ACP methyl ester carboxylesterase
MILRWSSSSSRALRPTEVFYLHGFASSAQSSKASYFAEQLAPYGISLKRPDFNAPDFASLTMTRMLEQLGREASAVAPTPIVLIGSSLGGALAILAAEKLARSVERIVLLAPAVMFARPGHHLLPPERVDQWRRQNAIPFFHYGYGEERLLNFTFHEDMVGYDVFAASFSQPALIFQGLHDESVDCRTVEQFARTRPNVELSLLDDDHQLLQSLPRIWLEIQRFLGLVGSSGPEGRASRGGSQPEGG